jgi:hypothetical protein
LQVRVHLENSFPDKGCDIGPATADLAAGRQEHGDPENTINVAASAAVNLNDEENP